MIKSTELMFCIHI